jgi:NAD(P)-dependent dehydrogenase (short-subunit alcohol dehydrogenase family)
MFKDDLLAGKRLLVSGGGTGLGREMTAKFAALGADVYICGRRLNKLQETADAITAEGGGKVLPMTCDIRVADAVEAMVEEIWNAGPLDGLVNNAAGNFISPTKDISPRGFDAIANIVLHGSFYMTSAVGKRWIAGGHKGSVISILTTWVRTGSPYVVPSAMAKTGVKAMTQSLAAEWGKYGIRLNAIAPGPFPTEGMSDRLMPGGGYQKQDFSSIPLGRDGEMSELQNLAAFLMSDGCDYLTGETIALDGGQWLTGGGTFSGLDAITDDQWAELREMIRATNAKDRAQRAG